MSGGKESEDFIKKDLADLEQEMASYSGEILKLVFGDKWSGALMRFFNDSMMGPIQIGTDEASLYKKAVQMLVLTFTPYFFEIINSIQKRSNIDVNLSSAYAQAACRGYLSGIVKKFNEAINMGEYDKLGLEIVGRYISSMSRDFSVSDSIMDAMRKGSDRELEYFRKKIFG